ncbi:hemolysin family protein [Corynebacterium anserum]|uniref:DUF21 domain-containing protein n=1 Tax=Corynebacterium anserum TaxID=2684406 RepID=A0A7G7YMQ2_9CORY|nr:hemolysin family protein [Corynebacterium anserum]MBC2681145.1 DUF21 domain-containing protein [Corynebacterium anserum]QNH95772.1 DUF21 domain-containing protein [Corynebacterium anserum]
MDTLTFVGILIGFLTLAFGGVISLMETAVGSISLARVENLVKEERHGSERLLRVVTEKAKHVNLLVLLRTVAEVTGAVMTTAVLLRVVEKDTWAIVWAVLVVTLYQFVVIGVLSRTLGRKNPYTISLKCAPVLLGLSKIFGLLAWLLVKAGNVLTPGEGFRDGPFATEIELREMVDIASERGIVESDERRMIQSVFDLADTTARTVMVPRPEMLWIEQDKTVSQALNLCIRSGHSRVPVIGEDVDDVVGVAYLKDLIAHVHRASEEERRLPVRDFMRSAKFVPDSRLLDDLLEEMQREQIHLAMLVDEYGAIAGLISMEDILEEIVGEISDEYDSSDAAPVEDLGDGSYRVLARLSLDEVEELFNDPEMVSDLDRQRESEGGDHAEPENKEPREGDLDALESQAEIPDIEFSAEQHEEVDTVAGLGAYELGRVPLPGAEISTAGLHFRFEGGKDRRGRMKIRSAVVRREPFIDATNDHNRDS